MCRGVVPGGAGHPQFLADQLTLFQSGWTDYAHLITTGTPGFSYLPTALVCVLSHNEWLKGLTYVQKADPHKVHTKASSQ